MVEFKVVANKSTKRVRCYGYCDHPYDSETEVLLTTCCQELYIDDARVNTTDKRSEWDGNTETPSFNTVTITITPSRPKNPVYGQIYLGEGAPIWWNGTNWINYNGTTA